LNYYWTYYAFTLFAAYAARNPWVCGVILVFYVARPILPDPVVLMRTLSRVGRLKAQARLNKANAVTRRDLGRAYLDLYRARTALSYLDEARELDRKDTEVAYLRGLALLRLKKDEEALRALAEAVGVDPDAGEPFSSARAGTQSFTRYAEAYLAAANALERLGRLPQAEDALTASVDCNSSLLEPLVRLGQIRRKRGDAAGAREALQKARHTWHELPGFMRRKQFGWWLRTWFA
jgi:tetratricopeptide (TPR) repeat protein